MASQILGAAHDKFSKRAGCNQNDLEMLKKTLKRQRRKYLATWSIIRGAMDIDEVIYHLHRNGFVSIYFYFRTMIISFIHQR